MQDIGQETNGESDDSSRSIGSVNEPDINP